MKIMFMKWLLLIATIVMFTACGGGGGSSSDHSESNPVVTHNGITYGTVISPYTGKTWLDRNLGAARVCTTYDDSACYGDYYQWGRNADGHEDSMSGTTSVQATDINSAGVEFIKDDSDWASVDADGSSRQANWSKTNGSSVCPSGFRVPSITDLKAELLDTGSAEIENSDDAYNSFLKLPSAGFRSRFSATVSGQSVWGGVWASSVDGLDSHGLRWGSDSASWSSYNRAHGSSVRCLKD